MTFFALVRNSPMVLIRSRTLASPSATIFAGVSASANSAGVALLTPASVACADSTTATSSVNGLTCSSSRLRLGIGGLEAAERFLDLGRRPLRQRAGGGLARRPWSRALTGFEPAPPWPWRRRLRGRALFRAACGRLAMVFCAPCFPYSERP